MGLADQLVIEGKYINIEEVLKNGFDVNLILAHEEPGPLTLLEVGRYGIPSICWSEGVGLYDIINDDNGWRIRYMDFKQLGQVLNEIKGNKSSIYYKGSNISKQILSEFNSALRAEELITALQHKW